MGKFIVLMALGSVNWQKEGKTFDSLGRFYQV